MKELFRFLHNSRILGRQIARPLAFRSNQVPKRDLIRRPFSLWMDGYNAGLEKSPEQLPKLFSTTVISDNRALFDGAFCSVASLHLTEGAGNQSIQTLLEMNPDLKGSVGLGIGAALSHLKVNVMLDESIVKQHWGWMCIDSYGFHEGYFNWPTTILRAQIPQNVSKEALSTFDKGVGRAVWGIGAGHPAAVAKFVRCFEKERHADLWQGVGLMLAYWGSCDATDLRHFLRFAGPNREDLQLGVAQATLMRMDSDEVVDFTEGACNIICQASSRSVAELVRTSFDQNLVEFWQFTIKKTFKRA